MDNTQRLTNTSTKQQWIAEQARKHLERVLSSLHPVMNIDWLREAYKRARQDGAVGVDGVTAQACTEDLEANQLDLLKRIKSGSYQAPPVRRHWIPKGDGSSRGLGIPTFEDKVAQRAILMVLEAIYEQDFLSCSYGFRPDRGGHGARDAIRTGIMAERCRFVIDADISKYLDSIEHGQLRAFLDLRIKDGVIRRMIDKWLKTGILDPGFLKRSESGTPQGGVVNPCLSDIFLHHVLDRWHKQEVKPRLRRRSCLVRHADDFVLLFELGHEAGRVLEVLAKQFDRFGLTLHPVKTRFLDFRPPQGKDATGNENVGFPGFTHVWGRSWKGYRVLCQVTSKVRFASAIKTVYQWCKWNRHRLLIEQQEHLLRVIRSHCAYYGITGNMKRLSMFRYQVLQGWRKALSRRSRDGNLNREDMNMPPC